MPTSTTDTEHEAPSGMATRSKTLRRLTLLVGTYVLVAALGAYLGAYAGVSPLGPALLAIAVVAVSGVRSAVGSLRTSDADRAVTFEVRHLIVWVATILAGGIASIIWMTSGSELPSSALVWTFTGIAVLGTGVTHFRAKRLIDERYAS